jgi:molybdate transport system substrate-binding protein
MTFLRSLVIFFACLTPAMADHITVFAASSLKTTLDQIARDWQKQSGNTVTISYDSSAKLAKQIEQGAPADLFMSASKQWMDYLSEAKLIQVASRKDILGNSLILIAADPAAPQVKIAQGHDLEMLLGDGKLAMGLVESVPVGQYGKEALTNLGLWDRVASQVVQADNARAAVKLVATGEAAFGIVYATDAEDGVTQIGTFPDDSHNPIVYPAAVTSTNPAAQEFLNYLGSDAASGVFAKAGFVVLKLTIC